MKYRVKRRWSRPCKEWWYDAQVRKRVLFIPYWETIGSSNRPENASRYIDMYLKGANDMIITQTPPEL